VLVVDTNVLIYAVHSASSRHDVASRWLRAAGHGAEVLGLPWQSLLGFVRITTDPRVFAAPLAASEAMAIVQDWLAHPAVVVPEPTARHATLLAGLLTESGTAGNLTSDAHLAALALEHGGSVVTFDRDLARFGVPVLVPS